MDVVLGLAEVLPDRALLRQGDRALRPHDPVASPAAATTSAALERELYLAATDLDTCERVVFGSAGFDDVPISTAVSASSALPMVYTPCGSGTASTSTAGIVSTTNLDIAVDAGARFIVVVNPLVPYVNEFEREYRRSPAPAPAACPTWASPTSATRRSSCSPTSGCTRRPRSGRPATPASTSS